MDRQNHQRMTKPTGMKFINVIYGCFLLCCTACLGPEIEMLDFFSVVLLPPATTENLGTLQLQGVISSENPNTIEDHGFLWSTDIQELSGDMPTAQLVSLGNHNGNGAFDYLLENLELGEIYYFRAYARAGEREVWSNEIFPFAFGVSLDAIIDRSIENNTALIKGLILGLDTLRTSVASYGHVYSATNPNPDLATDLHTDLGTLSADGNFESLLENLEFNTTYYIKAYVKTANGQEYFSEADTFAMEDGWSPSNGPGAMIGALSAQIGSSVYVIGGARSFEDYSVINLVDSLWQYSIASGIWTSRPVSEDLARTEGVFFALDGKLFYGLGKQFSGVGFPLILDFRIWYLNPENSQDAWTPSDIPIAMSNRVGAAYFVLGQKAYIGTGLGPQDDLLHDWWELSAPDLSWRRVKSMLQVTNPASGTTGRQKAVTFVVQDQGYVGAGYAGIYNDDRFPLNDFWQFEAPQGLVDSGQWIQKEAFPGTPRYHATAIAIHDQAYYGLGLNLDIGFLSDWWAFNPGSNGGNGTWEKKTDFQGMKRELALGFSAEGKGYLGLGGARLIANEVNLNYIVYDDFWIYHPEE